MSMGTPPVPSSKWAFTGRMSAAYTKPTASEHLAESREMPNLRQRLQQVQCNQLQQRINALSLEPKVDNVHGVSSTLAKEMRETKNMPEYSLMPGVSMDPRNAAAGSMRLSGSAASVSASPRLSGGDDGSRRLSTSQMSR